MGAVTFETYGITFEDNVVDNDQYDAGEKITQKTSRGKTAKSKPIAADSPGVQRILNDLKQTSLKGLSLSNAAAVVDGLSQAYNSVINFIDAKDILDRAQAAAIAIGGPTLDMYTAKLDGMYDHIVYRARDGSSSGYIDGTVKIIERELSYIATFGKRIGKTLPAKDREAILTDALKADTVIAYRDAEGEAQREWLGVGDTAEKHLTRLDGIKQKFKAAHPELAAVADKVVSADRVAAIKKFAKDLTTAYRIYFDQSDSDALLAGNTKEYERLSAIKAAAKTPEQVKAAYYADLRGK